MKRLDGREYHVKAAPLICYEDTLPTLARQATRQGAQLLVNLTFDTWFGRTHAPYQHHLIAAFRAIENRRYLIRCTNSGYSAVVDPDRAHDRQHPRFHRGHALGQGSINRRNDGLHRVSGRSPMVAVARFAAGAMVVEAQKRRRALPVSLAPTSISAS